MSAIDKRLKLELLQQQCNILVAEIEHIERICPHKWGPTVYAPVPTQDWVLDGYEGLGSDPVPFGHCIPGTPEPRWKRICLNCGKVECTYETMATERKPVF